MNYLIEYTAKTTQGVVIKSGKMRVKNKMSTLHAQLSFEDYLKSKMPNFGVLIVHDCKEEMDNDFLNIFKDIFK